MKITLQDTLAITPNRHETLVLLIDNEALQVSQAELSSELQASLNQQIKRANFTGKLGETLAA